MELYLLCGIPCHVRCGALRGLARVKQPDFSAIFSDVIEVRGKVRDVLSFNGLDFFESAFQFFNRTGNAIKLFCAEFLHIPPAYQAVRIFNPRLCGKNGSNFMLGLAISRT